MLTDRTRNFIVAFTMLAALGAFFYGIYVLGRFPQFTQGDPYVVRLQTKNASGLMYGDKLDMNGVFVGKVESVHLTPHLHGAIVRLHVHHGINIPSNAIAYIGKTTIGSPYVTIAVPPGPVAGPLPKNGSAVMQARAASSSLIPQTVVSDISTMREHLTALSGKLSRVADDLHALLRPETLAAAGKPGKAAQTPNISQLVQRLNKTVHGLNGIVGNPKLQKQARDLIANLDAASQRVKSVLNSVHHVIKTAHVAMAAFSADAKNVGSTVTAVRDKITTVTQRLGSVLKNLDVATSAIARGKGTAGRLINDPRLYNGLVDLTKRLKSTVTDLHILVKKIQQEGFQLNVHL